MAKLTRYPELFQLRLPGGAGDALDKLASLTCMSRSECIRQTLWRELRANGIDLHEAADASGSPLTAEAPSPCIEDSRHG
jgi:hypothetical protein